MQRHRPVDVDEGVARIGEAAAEIVVLVEQEDLLIEAAAREEAVAPRHQAGPREEGRAGVPRRQGEAALRVLQVGGEVRAAW